MEAFAGRAGLGPTVKATVGILDGRPVAIGGLAFSAGRVIAFADLGPDVRRFKVALHREALRVLDGARKAGHRRIYAEPDANEPTARKWLARLGFRPSEDNEAVWIWRA